MAELVEPCEVDLFQGMDDVIANALGIASHRSKTAALLLCRPERQLDGVRLIAALFERMEANWNLAMSRSPRGSKQNFRWHAPQLFISPHNTSPEVSLERALMSALNSAGRAEWANQVPVVSGITSGGAGKRRAVDLVHQLKEGSFEFIELKVATDTPLFAALEVLGYGMFWLLSRHDKHRLGYNGRVMIEAASLELSVLAPRPFYRRYEVRPLANSLDDGIRTLGAKFGVDMRFSFAAFGRDFVWPFPYSGDQLIAQLDQRERV